MASFDLKTALIDPLAKAGVKCEVRGVRLLLTVNGEDRGLIVSSPQDIEKFKTELLASITKAPTTQQTPPATTPLYTTPQQAPQELSHVHGRWMSVYEGDNEMESKIQTLPVSVLSKLWNKIPRARRDGMLAGEEPELKQQFRQQLLDLNP